MGPTTMMAMLDRLAMQQRVEQMHHTRVATSKTQSKHPATWVGVVCVGEWRRGEERNVLV